MFVNIGPSLRQYIVVIVANFAVLCVGLSLAWPSPVLVKLFKNDTETVLSRSITEEEGSWIVSIGFLTGSFANFLAVFLVDWIGRKYCLLLTCFPKLLVCVMTTFATEVWMVLVARAVGGITDTIIFLVVPIYASEIASKEIRGALGTIFQILCSLGVVLILSFGPYTSYYTLNLIFTLIVALTNIPMLFLPHSPYFLHSKGQTDEATKVLTFLRGSEELAKEEIKTYARDENISITKIDILRSKLFLKALSIVVLLGICSQLIGFNAVTFYLQTVLVSTQTTVSSEMASVIIGLIQLTASFCTAVVTDKFGRKPILAVSLIGMALGMVGLGVFFKVKETSEIIGFMNYLPLFSLILVVYCYSAGMGSLIWILGAELFDGPSRGIGLSISSVTCTMFVFLTTKYFAALSTAIGPAATYFLFSVNCVLTCLFIIFCVPETKGKSFGEIQKSLRGS